MRPQWVPHSHSWVIEIEFREMLHSDFFHHASRPNIGGNRDGYDFVEFEGFKRISNCASCAFRCQTFSPVLMGKPPANLNGGLRYERYSESHRNQTDKTDKFSGLD